jgi:hypothetical protein
VFGRRNLEPDFGPAQRDSVAVQEIVMARVIEFYEPGNFRKPWRSAPQLQSGKVIEFRSPTSRSAELTPSIIWKLGRSWNWDEAWPFSAH